MPSIGTPGSATYAETLSGIGAMLTVLPDNTANQIQASDVRNVVYTLYDELQGFSASLTSISSQTYSNPNPVSQTVGGVTAGSTFSDITYQQLLDILFYPYVAPVLTLTSSNSVLEYGNSQSVTLSWSVTMKKNQLVSASINEPGGSPVNITPLPTVFNTSTSGTTTRTPLLNTLSIFTFSVDDTVISPSSGGVNNATVSVSWSSRIYWGVSSTTSSVTISSEISGLTGASIGSGSQLTTTRVRNYDGINGSGEYLMFSWPTSYGTPSFLVNGAISNAFTKVNSSFGFTNSFGYNTPYDVWKSDTIQNSPIENFQIN